MKKFVPVGILLFYLITLLPAVPVLAAPFESRENGFSMDPPAPWKQIPQASFQGGVVSYAKEGSTALFHVTVRDMDEPKSTADLKWEDLFKPQFESILIGTEGETLIGGEKAKYCVYTIKPGPFKTQMEGKIPAKYMNYVIVRGKKLFSITYVDTLEGFSFNYSSFLAAVRTISFGEVRLVLRAPEKQDPESSVIKSPAVPEGRREETKKEARGETDGQ